MHVDHHFRSLVWIFSHLSLTKTTMVPAKRWQRYDNDDLTAFESRSMDHDPTSNVALPQTSNCNFQIKQGSITSSSYVPAGLTAEEYKKVRDADAAKAAAKYDFNVKKAGKFLGFDEFYQKRGTDPTGSWLKAPGRGHTFAKTKYDYSGAKDDTKGWRDSIGTIFGK